MRIMLLDLQRALRSAVRSAQHGAAEGALAAHVAVPRGPVAVRVNVYRNTAQTSLIDVLAAAFPVVQRIVGAEYFVKLAREFVTSAPPRLAHLSAYGNGLSGFIAARAEDHRLPYLADVARLEWARAEAYFAADAALCDPATLITGNVGDLRFTPHPATRLVRAAFPIMTIWRANQPDNANVPQIDMGVDETALISRPGMAVITRQISEGDAALLEALMADKLLGEAAEAALSRESSFDLQAALDLHLRHGTFAAA
jgi:hypothetical protein